MALNNEPLGTDNAAGLVVTHAKVLRVVTRANFRALEDGDVHARRSRRPVLSARVGDISLNPGAWLLRRLH